VNRNYNAIKITKYGYLYYSQGSTVTSGNSIVGLNFQAETSVQGGIYFQNLYSPSLAFNRTQSTINRVNSGFVPTNMFRITYFNVPVAYNSNPVTVKASFQVILASDSTKSYIVLNYTDCLASAPLETYPGLLYLSQNGQQLSAFLDNPCGSSNVNLYGNWVFDVSNTFSKNFSLFKCLWLRYFFVANSCSLTSLSNRKSFDFNTFFKNLFCSFIPLP
jgi:hypothetical protein